MAKEQRLNNRLQAYWELTRKGKKFPQIEHFNNAVVEDLWPQCVVFSIDTRKGIVFKIDTIGEYIIKAAGKDMAGQMVESNSATFPGRILYKQLVSMVPAPELKVDGGFFLKDNGVMEQYRAIFLPFGNDFRGLTHVIVGLSFRSF